jgi:hypothetical protein
MPVTRSQTRLKNNSQDDKDAALILLRLNKENDYLKKELNLDIVEELRKKKEELRKLKEIKKMTDKYNMLSSLIRNQQAEADRLEIAISELLSSQDK